MSDAAPDGTDAAVSEPPDALQRSDAAASTSEATSYAIDPAHDSLQPTDAVASPLVPRWTGHFDGSVSYPLVTGGRVIIATAGSLNCVRALDLETGAPLWGPVVFSKRVTIAYDGSRVFALDPDGNLSALDVASGTLLWSMEFTPKVSTDPPPVAIGGLVYVNRWGLGTVAVDESDGTVRWAGGDYGSDGTVAVASGVVYEEEGCKVSSFDAAAGTLNWLHSTSSCTSAIGGAPAFYQGFVYARDPFGSNLILGPAGNLVGTFPGRSLPAFDGDVGFFTVSNTADGSTALDATVLSTGTFKWEFAGDARLCTTPVVAGGGGQVFVGSESGNVYEVDEATGAQVSVSNAGNGVTCASEHDSMAVASGHLLVPAVAALVVY